VGRGLFLWRAHKRSSSYVDLRSSGRARPTVWSLNVTTGVEGAGRNWTSARTQFPLKLVPYPLHSTRICANSATILANSASASTDSFTDSSEARIISRSTKDEGLPQILRTRLSRFGDGCPSVADTSNGYSAAGNVGNIGWRKQTNMSDVVTGSIPARATISFNDIRNFRNSR